MAYIVNIAITRTAKGLNMNEINHKAMTEAAIERAAERAMDRLDRRLAMGTLTTVQYEIEVKELDKWTQQEYRRART